MFNAAPKPPLPAKSRLWKWGHSLKANSGGSTVMECLPTFSLLLLGHANSGKQSLFERITTNAFHTTDPAATSTTTRDTNILTGVRSMQLGTGKYNTTCWCEVLCTKANSFDPDRYMMLEHLWRTTRGVILILDAVECFTEGSMEQQVNGMLAHCKRLEREVLGVETQIMIVVTKCDLLYQECGLTPKEVFGNVLQNYSGMDYLYTSSKVWSNTRQSNHGMGGAAWVNPGEVLKILMRKMLEWHLNFEKS